MISLYSIYHGQQQSKVFSIKITGSKFFSVIFPQSFLPEKLGKNPGSLKYDAENWAKDSIFHNFVLETDSKGELKKIRK